MQIATRRMALATVLGLSMVAGMAGRTKAGLITIADRMSDSFVSIQLRGLGFNPSGEEVEVFVYDISDDPNSFARLAITNADTAATIYDRTFGPDIGQFNTPGTAAESFVLPYNVPLQIVLSGQEFSRVVLFLGGTRVAEGDEENVFQSFTTTVTITNALSAVPEPSTLISGGLAGAVGLGLAWRHRRARTTVPA